MNKESEEIFDEEEYVDVRSLPLQPPKPAPPQEKPVRRVWHPVMWDNSTDTPIVNNTDEDRSPSSGSRPARRRSTGGWQSVSRVTRGDSLMKDSVVSPKLVEHISAINKNAERLKSREYPHKQRIRNLKRLIAEGKVKPTSETLIFFLCNKFAISEDRQSKLL